MSIDSELKFYVVKDEGRGVPVSKSEDSSRLDRGSKTSVSVGSP